MSEECLVYGKPFKCIILLVIITAFGCQRGNDPDMLRESDPVPIEYEDKQ